MSELLRFLVQVIVIVAVSRFAGAILARCGQPAVIGEILAGVLLGPCFLGWVAPTASAALFPSQSLSLLNIVSQFGLILFMFLVGLRLETAHIQSHRNRAIWISITSVVVPFAAGMALAGIIRTRLAPADVGWVEFAFFLGVAMSVTAFPVLARILEDTGLIRTPLGAIAIACAAVDDVAAWILLAGGIAVARPGVPGAGIGTTLVLLAAYAAAVILARPLLSALASSREAASSSRLTAVVLAGMISAAATEWIGIHALFGAFFMGIAMPKHRDKHRDFVNEVSAALQPVATLLLLPIFFAYTGLRMNLQMVSVTLLLDGLAILLVAVLGKGGAAMLAARVAGLSWRESVSLGALLNTRGLVELVVLNVGLDLGILTPELFSLMVLMALITTGMTSPLLRVAQLGRSAVSARTASS
jgi:Kef-type K+ transport system membrane component KefB